MLIDLRGTAWVIDYGEVSKGLPLVDLVRLMIHVLFDYTKLESIVEMEEACSKLELLLSFDDLRDAGSLETLGPFSCPRV